MFYLYVKGYKQGSLKKRSSHCGGRCQEHQRLSAGAAAEAGGHPAVPWGGRSPASPCRVRAVSRGTFPALLAFLGPTQKRSHERRICAVW